MSCSISDDKNNHSWSRLCTFSHGTFIPRFCSRPDGRIKAHDGAEMTSMTLLAKPPPAASAAANNEQRINHDGDQKKDEIIMAMIM
jgi:hypothetical protein